MSVSEEDLLERALARTEADVTGALRAAIALTRELKKAQKSAAGGTIRDLEKALESADELGGTLREALRSARSGWRFDVTQHFESGGYVRELLSRAQELGVNVQEQDDRILSFPSLARLAAKDLAIDVDKKRERAIRPSVVIERFRAARDRPVRFKAAPFLEALLQAYRLVLAEEGANPGAVAKVVDIYRVLTVLPGSGQAYSKQEFTRDLYLLEESGEIRTREGLEVAMAAATGTKGRDVLNTVSRDGRVRTYYGVAFS